ncbi:hypothetical protein [Sphingomonas sp. ABOLG]|uniref:hypothetical protein n=1 Tax=Sphingomonas sp. ABOLG TaxID=1985880 RepID=UPI0013DDF8F1|nr:hypothetical protein [Sphingomonas sp. ABOLG]
MTIAEPVFTEMLSRIRRAAKNGTRLHLEPEHVTALLDDDIYAVLSAREAMEIRRKCRPVQQEESAAAPPQPQPGASNLVPSGFGIVPIATTGTSVGSTAVSRAAHRRVSEVAANIRQKRRKSA